MTGNSGIQAERIKNPIALFSGLDKITGVTTNFEVDVGARKSSSAILFVKPFRVLHATLSPRNQRPPAFVQVDVQESDGKPRAHLLRLDVRRKPRPQRR